MAQPCDYLKIGKTLGNGAYGTVYKVTADDGSIYALKSFKVDDVRLGVETPVELNIMFGIQSPYLQEGLKIYTPGECNDLIGILQPWRQSDFIRFVEGNPLYADIKTIFLHAALGVRVLHKRGYLHLDIKNANILVETTHTPQNTNVVGIVTDFGLAAVYDKEVPLKTIVERVTSLYRAPEGFLMTHTGEYTMTPKIDIWSLGMTYLYALNGFHYIFYDLTVKNMNRLNSLRYMLPQNYDKLGPRDVDKNIINQYFRKDAHHLMAKDGVNISQILEKIKTLSRSNDVYNVTEFNILRVLVEPGYMDTQAYGLDIDKMEKDYPLLGDRMRDGRYIEYWHNLQTILTFKKYVNADLMIGNIFGYGNVLERLRFLFPPRRLTKLLTASVKDMVPPAELPVFIDLMSHMFDFNVNSRYDIEQVIDHPYFRNIKDIVKATTGDQCTIFPIYPMTQPELNDIHLGGLANLIKIMSDKLNNVTIDILFLAIDIYLRSLPLCGQYLNNIDCEILTRASISLAYKFYMHSSCQDLINLTIAEANMEIHIARALEGIIYRDNSLYVLSRCADELILLYKFVIEEPSSLNHYLRIDIGFLLEMLTLTFKIDPLSNKQITVREFITYKIPQKKVT
jgi:serine/threonine protein kinase